MDMFQNWKMLKEQVPPSLFLRMQDPSKYLGISQRSTGIARASDPSVYYRQYPVGWMFYTQSNINLILQTLQKINPSLKFEDIQRDMEWIYNTMGREGSVVASNPIDVAKNVQRLNDETTRIAMNRLKTVSRGIDNYATYMQNPNFMASTPAYLQSHKVRTIESVANHESVPQSGTFTSKTFAGQHGTPVVQPLTRYV